MARLPLSLKLYGLTGIPLLLGIVIAGLLVHRLDLAFSATDQILSQSARQQSIARDMRYTFKRQVQEWKDTLLRGHNPDDLKHYSESFHKQFKRTQELSAELQTLLADPKARELNTQFRL